MSAAPLTLGELGAALAAIGGFDARPFIAVAVSGGPDSLALTILADRWARERGGRLAALTVDHQLRSESAEEARLVGGWLAARGIAHHVLVWTNTKPATGIQKAALEREASHLHRKVGGLVETDREVVVSLAYSRFELVSQTVIERELRDRPELVLRVTRVVVNQVLRRRRIDDAAGRRVAEKKARERVAARRRRRRRRCAGTPRRT